MWIGRKGTRLRSSLMINIAYFTTALALANSHNSIKGIDLHKCSVNSFLKDFFWNVIALSVFGLCHDTLTFLKLREPFPDRDLKVIVPLMLMGSWAWAGIGVLPELCSIGLKTLANNSLCVRDLFWGNKALSFGYELAKFAGYHILPLGIMLKDCPKVFKYKVEGSFAQIRKIKRVRLAFICTLIFFVLWLQLGLTNCVAKLTFIFRHPSVPEATLVVAEKIIWGLNYLLVLFIPIFLYISDPARRSIINDRSTGSVLNFESAIPLEILEERARSPNPPISIEGVEDLGTPVRRWNHLPVWKELQERRKSGWPEFGNGLPIPNTFQAGAQARKLTPPKIPPKSLKLRGKPLKQIQVQVQVHVVEEQNERDLNPNCKLEPKPEPEITFQKMQRTPSTPKIPKKLKVTKPKLQQIPIEPPIHVLPLDNEYARVPNPDFMDPALFLPIKNNIDIYLQPPSPDNTPRLVQLPFDHQTIQACLSKYYPEDYEKEDKKEPGLLTKEKLEAMSSFPYAKPSSDDGDEEREIFV